MNRMVMCVGVGGLGLGQVFRLGTGHVGDDLGRLVGIFFGIEFAVDGGEGAEELIGDVSEDGGTTGRDFVFGEEKEKAGEEVVDGDGGAEFLEVGGEEGGSVGGVRLVFREAWGCSGGRGGGS